MNTHDLYHEVLTETIKTVNPSILYVPFVSYMGGYPNIREYGIPEVVSDYGVSGKPLKALLDVLRYSSCHHVAEYRKILAEEFARVNADDLESFKGE